MIEKLELFSSRRERESGYIILEEVKGRPRNCKAIGRALIQLLKKINDVVYCIQRTSRHRKKVVHSDRLAPFLERD